MAKDKPSFFERLTGTVSIEDYEDDVFEEERETEPKRAPGTPAVGGGEIPPEEMAEDSGDGQLSVDVYQTPDDIIIKAHVAGIRPDGLDVSITRDMVTIKGHREDAREVTEDNYFYRELFWGSFSRTILLPQEVEVEGAEAIEKHGLLTLRLPKIDKERQTKLKVKGN